MLHLLAISSAFAFDFPAGFDAQIKAQYVEYTGWGESPTVVDTVASADVSLTNPTTGASFTTDGELLLAERTGAGTGELQFAGDPSGTLHTWAVYLLDADGNLLSEKPEIVDVLFGDDGDGTIVARDTADIVVKAVKVRKRNISRVSGPSEDGTHTVSMTVRDSGVRAAYLGIQEIASDGATLNVQADMEAMTADVYATFQGQLLDALVPLDTWRVVVEGTVAVDGLGVSAEGVVESGNALDWGVTFYESKVDEKGAVSQGYAIATQDYSVAFKKLKGSKSKGYEAYRVKLTPDDAVFDSYDGAMNLLFDGDARSLELAAILRPLDSSAKPVTEGLLAFDPSDAAVTAAFLGTRKYPKEDSYDSYLLTLEGETPDGKPDGTKRLCALTPTAKSTVANGKTLRWTGECLRDEDGRNDTRAVAMTLTKAGVLTVTAEVLGASPKAGAAADVYLATIEDSSGQLLLQRKRSTSRVSATSFSVDWTFPGDIDGGEYTLELDVYGATNTPTLEIVGDGWYAWDFAEPTWTSGKDKTGAYARATTDGTAERFGANALRGSAAALE